MGREVSITIYCRNGKHRYEAIYEEKTPGEWYCIESKPLPPMGFFERRRMKKEQNSATSNLSKTAPTNTTTVNGTFYTGGKLKCPTCGNTSYVRCGRCKALTCLPQGSKSFSCAVCGNQGTIKGTIKSMSANTNGSRQNANVQQNNSNQQGNGQWQ